MKSNADRLLIARCRAGKASAWGTLLQDYHDGVGRFVFLSEPALRETEVAEVCRRTFLQAIAEINGASEAMSCRVWLLRLASQEAHRFTRRGSPTPLQKTGDVGALAAGPTAQHESDITRDVAGHHLRHLLDRLAGPCLALAELWFFSDATEAEVGAALDISRDAVSRRLLMCLHRLQTLDPAGADARQTAYPHDFGRTDVGHPLGAQLAAYAKRRGAQLTPGFPVPEETRTQLLAALRSEVGNPLRTPIRSVLSLVTPRWRMTAVAASCLLVLVLLLAMVQRGCASARARTETAAAPSYSSTQSLLPRAYVPEDEAGPAARADAIAESGWTVVAAEPTMGEVLPTSDIPRTESAEASTDSAQQKETASPPGTNASLAAVQPGSVGGPSDAGSLSSDTSESESLTQAEPARLPEADTSRTLLAVSTPPEAGAATPAAAQAETQLAPALAKGGPERMGKPSASRQRHFESASPASRFRRNFNSPPMPAVMATFTVEMTETGMSIIDADGSVYEVVFDLGVGGATLPPTPVASRDNARPGPQDNAAFGATPSPASGGSAALANANDTDGTTAPSGYALAFQALGAHRTTGESVVFRGWLIPRGTDPAATPSLASHPPGSAAVPRVPVRAPMIGRAVPAGPPTPSAVSPPAIPVDNCG